MAASTHTSTNPAQGKDTGELIRDLGRGHVRTGIAGLLSSTDTARVDSLVELVRRIRDGRWQEVLGHIELLNEVFRGSGGSSGGPVTGWAVECVWRALMLDRGCLQVLVTGDISLGKEFDKAIDAKRGRGTEHWSAEEYRSLAKRMRLTERGVNEQPPGMDDSWYSRESHRRVWRLSKLDFHNSSFFTPVSEAWRPRPITTAQDRSAAAVLALLNDDLIKEGNQPSAESGAQGGVPGVADDLGDMHAELKRRFPSLAELQLPRSGPILEHARDQVAGMRRVDDHLSRLGTPALDELGQPTHDSLAELSAKIRQEFPYLLAEPIDIVREVFTRHFDWLQ